MAIVAIMRQNARFRVNGVDYLSRGGDMGLGGCSEHSLVDGLNNIRLHPKQPAAGRRRDYIAPFVNLITSPEVICA